MQKNWYVIYTKPNCEKKVATYLAKRKIENFCPYNRKKLQHLRNSKLVIEPLFSSYVFVNIFCEEINLVEQIENVVGLVYWKFRPAIVKDEDIEVIKDFTSHYTNIKLEKNSVSINSYSRNSGESENYTIDGKVLRIINKSIKVNLPSLGFAMIAELAAEGSKERMISFGNHEFVVQS